MKAILPSIVLLQQCWSILHLSYISEPVMRFDCQILLKLRPLNLLPGSALDCLWRVGCVPNRISFDVSDRCFCKVETRASETLRSCAKHLDGLAITALPGASRLLFPALNTSTKSKNVRINEKYPLDVLVIIVATLQKVRMNVYFIVILSQVPTFEL